MSGPLSVLLEARARRRRTPVWAWWLGLAVPALALEVLPGVPRPWLLVLLAVLASAWPLQLACQGASALATLRRGRGLEELLGSPTSPTEIADGLARHAVLAVLSGWGWLGTLWLVWGIELLHLTPMQAVAAVPPGLAMQAVLAGVASYVAQAGFAWSDGENDLGARHLLVAPLLLPGLALLAVPPLGLAVLVLTARSLAASGLSGQPRLREAASRLWRRLGRGTGRGRSGNAIVYRECRAEAGRTPGGLGGLLLARHGLAGLVLAGLLALSAAGLERAWGGLAGVLWSGLVILFLLQTMRAAYGTVGSLVDEREGRTLETLLGTALTPGDLADGWARVSALPRTLENLAAAGAFVGLGALAGLPPERMGLCAWILATFTVAASYAGVAVSAASPGRQEAMDRMGLALAGGVWVVGMLGLLVAFQGRQEFVPAAAGLGAAAVVACRGRALAMLGGEAPEVTVSRLRTWLPGALRRRLRRREMAARLAEGLPGRAPADFRARLMERLRAEGRLD